MKGSGEGRLGAQPLGVVAGGDQQLPGGVDPDPGQGDQCGGDRGDQFLELGVELGELGLELLPASGEGPQAGLGRGRCTSQGPGPHRCTGRDQGLGLEPEQWLAQLVGSAIAHPYSCSAAATLAFMAPRRATRSTRIIST
jgi:hypothetical protein